MWGKPLVSVLFFLSGMSQNCQKTCFYKFYKLLYVAGWFKSLLPKSALSVEEEAWNAYPYTKTRYTCPFVEKFSLEIETKYFPDNGHQENVFQLSGSELRNRIVGQLICTRHYCKEEIIQNMVS